jgi:hypothetical protein
MYNGRYGYYNNDLGPFYIRSQGQGWIQIKHSDWCNHWNQPQGFTLGIEVGKDFFFFSLPFYDLNFEANF